MNGLDRFKVVEILAFMSTSSIYGLLCVNRRSIIFEFPSPRSSIIFGKQVTELGPEVVSLVSSPTELISSPLEETIKVGGNVIVLNNRWVPYLIHFKSNPSQL